MYVSSYQTYSNYTVSRFCVKDSLLAGTILTTDDTVFIAEREMKLKGVSEGDLEEKTKHLLQEDIMHVC